MLTCNYQEYCIAWMAKFVANADLAGSCIEDIDAYSICAIYLLLSPLVFELWPKIRNILT